jgi:hypothetical protein
LSNLFSFLPLAIRAGFLKTFAQGSANLPTPCETNEAGEPKECSGKDDQWKWNCEEEDAYKRGSGESHKRTTL